jgi:hypothetical protein
VNIGWIIIAFLLLNKKTATATPLSARPGSTAANARGAAPSAGKPAGGPAPAGAGRGGSSLLSSVEDFFGFTNLDSPNLINPFDSGPLVSPVDSNGITAGLDSTVDDPFNSGGVNNSAVDSLIGSFNSTDVPLGPTDPAVVEEVPSEPDVPFDDSTGSFDDSGGF